MDERPAAAVSIGVLGRGRELAGQSVGAMNERGLVAVAIDLQRPTLRRRAAVEGDSLPRLVGDGVGVGVDLRPFGIFARRLVPDVVAPVLVGVHPARALRPYVLG